MFVIISDLHIGSGPLDDCDGELEQCLVGFLNKLSAEDSEVELIINGDFLDFAQAAPWQGSEFESATEGGIVDLCFTEEQSLEKLKTIHAAHKPIFDGLKNFLSSGSNRRLVVMPGNHDADFFWDEVRKLFGEKVCGSDPDLEGRLSFHLETEYRPARFPRLWVEHGHQYDPVNRFFVKEVDPSTGAYAAPRQYWSAARPPIFTDRSGVRRLYECLGTRFMIRYMNGLDSDYPFVDNVKPFGRFLKLFATSVIVPGYGVLKVTAATTGILRYLAREGLMSPGNVMGIEKSGAAEMSELLRKVAERTPPAERQDFVRRLEERGFRIKGTLGMFVAKPENAARLMVFLADNPELTDGLRAGAKSLLGNGNGKLTLRKSFSVNETAELIKASRKILAAHPDVETVVMGHTHEPVCSPQYINTGSWTRYYFFDKGEKTHSWRKLRADQHRHFPYQLNYAEVIPDRPIPAQLRNYAESPKP